jgi:hypothetical protein
MAGTGHQRAHAMASLTQSLLQQSMGPEPPVARVYQDELAPNGRRYHTSGEQEERAFRLTSETGVLTR